MLLDTFYLRLTYQVDITKDVTRHILRLTYQVDITKDVTRHILPSLNISS